MDPSILFFLPFIKEQTRVLRQKLECTWIEKKKLKISIDNFTVTTYPKCAIKYVFKYLVDEAFPQTLSHLSDS